MVLNELPRRRAAGIRIECFKFAASGREYDPDPDASLGINSTTSFQFSAFGGF